MSKDLDGIKKMELSKSNNFRTEEHGQLISDKWDHQYLDLLLNYKWESKKVRLVHGNGSLSTLKKKKPIDLGDPKKKARLMFTDADMAMAMDPEYRKKFQKNFIKTEVF